MIVKRPAVREDFREFYGRLPEALTRAIVWEDQGEIVAVVGYVSSNGIKMVFSDIARRDIPVLKVWREAKAYLAELSDAYCTADEGSERFLTMLGWKPTAVEGVYAWRN